jgi:hypothetical protein
MSVNLSPVGNGFQFMSSTIPNVPLAGGFLYTYQAGSTTPLATYTDNTGTVANSNPIILNTDGRTPNEIWLTSGYSYKFVLTDSNNTAIQTLDNLYGIIGTSPSVSPIPSGSIIMWSGSIGAIPTGYVLCNGSNGTPDLRDRFIVGAGNTYSVGNNGGFVSSGVVTSSGTNTPLYYALAFIQKT